MLYIIETQVKVEKYLRKNTVNMLKNSRLIISEMFNIPSYQ